MEQECGVVCDGLPPLSAKYPWLVSQTPDEDGQIFCTTHDQVLHYRCGVQELRGKRIRGCFYGWVILSNNVMWSLWNPVTGKTIHFPPLVLDDGDCEDISHCCLPFHPDDPSSILLLTRATKSTFVFCRIDSKEKKLIRSSGWTELSYLKQLERISGGGSLIHSLACCDGKVFALNTDGNLNPLVIYLDIAVKDGEVAIKLMLFGGCPLSDDLYYFDELNKKYFLKGSGSIVFCIVMAYNEETKKTLGVVSLFKLDMASINWEELVCLRDWDRTGVTYEAIEQADLTYFDRTSLMWEEMLDLKDAIFFVDPTGDYTVFYSPVFAAELSGYIHVRGESGEMIHSCHLKNKTISISLMHSQVHRYVSLWECRLDGDHADHKLEEKDNEVVVRRVADDGDGVENVNVSQSHLLKLPLHMLEMIMEHCACLEYLKFRATCKRCHSAAPSKDLSDKSALRRMQKYSLVSPSWLMEVHKNQGTCTFTDPMSGDKFFMKRLDVPIYLDKIRYSRFGWLLFYSGDGLVFYNPFTSDVRQLPDLPYDEGSLCFSAPPTSPDCMVVLLPKREAYVYIHLVARKPSWRRIELDYTFTFCFPTFFGRNLYALCDNGELHVFKDLDQENYSFEDSIAGDPESCCSSRDQEQHFLTQCDQHLLLVIVGLSGESVEVFKLNDSTKEWEKLDNLGRKMIYICRTTCFCIEAKSQQMENKIYFSELHSKNKRIVFYSLETCKYDTFDPMGTEEPFSRISRYNTYPQTWIEASWS